MQKTIIRIIVFAWVLASGITWVDGALYMHKPDMHKPDMHKPDVHKPVESSKGAQTVSQNDIDYSRYLSPAACRHRRDELL